MVIGAEKVEGVNWLLICYKVTCNDFSRKIARGSEAQNRHILQLVTSWLVSGAMVDSKASGDFGQSQRGVEIRRLVGANLLPELVAIVLDYYRSLCTYILINTEKSERFYTYILLCRSLGPRVE